MRSSFYRLVPALFLLGVLPSLAQEGPAQPAPPAEHKPAATPQTALAATTPPAEAPCTGEVAACVKQIVEKLKKRGWIGMDLSLHPESRLPVVNAVTRGGPADSGGLKAGDVLLGQDGVRHDGKKHEDLAAVEGLHRQLTPGDTVTYVVRRDGKELELDVLLTEAPEDVIATWLGLTLYADHYKDKAAQPQPRQSPTPKPEPRP